MVHGLGPSTGEAPAGAKATSAPKPVVQCAPEHSTRLPATSLPVKTAATGWLVLYCGSMDAEDASFEKSGKSFSLWLPRTMLLSSLLRPSSAAIFFSCSGLRVGRGLISEEISGSGNLSVGEMPYPRKKPRNLFLRQPGLTIWWDMSSPTLYGGRCLQPLIPDTTYLIS